MLELTALDDNFESIKSTNSMMQHTSPQILSTPSGRKIAYHRSEGASPGVIFLGGFKSDMTGTKALFLEQWAQNQGQAFIRFDYSGHGQSSERFEDGTIGSWLEDARQILLQVTHQPQVLVGSSMGGWMSLLLARAFPDLVKGIVTIACATDFTEKLLKPAFTLQQLQELDQSGHVAIPSEYDQQPYLITQNLLSEGKDHLLLNDIIPIECPVHMLHGTEDVDVPWDISLQTLQKMASNKVTLELIKKGDHRLSTDSDLACIASAIERFL